ncbi:signal transduction histidine kinase [Methanococcoides alaskense]|uniref:histidine kinase n=2 Tax=Methanococcoides alaskense TaxID=325778 RepID=A0AA90Z5Q8_9EURY|nr:signal transduction histidine kinase [Methanococcoides alaskense]
MGDAVKAALSGKSVHYEGEYRSVISGKLTQIKADYSPYISEDGSLLGGIGIIEDIAERNRAEETLLLDESRLEALLQLNQMTDASLQEITDFTREEAVRLTQSKLGYLSFMDENETVLTMHSWSRDAMEECKIGDKPLVYPLETTGLWGEAVRQRIPIITNDYQAPNPFKKGYPEGHVELKRHMNVPIFDGDRIVIVAGVGNKEENYDESDIRQLTLLMQGMWTHIQHKLAADELKQYSQELTKINKELSEANEELKSLDKMKDEFISNVSHELKTPLVSIIGYSELIYEGTLGNVRDQQKNALETILRNSKRLRRLVDSLLHMSLTQAEAIEYVFEPVQIAEIIDDAITDMIPLINEKNLTIKKDVPDNLSDIRGDEHKLTDLFTHLIDNAVKFTPSGEITLETYEEEDSLHIKVSDTGIGIAKDLIPHLFQKFYQVDSSIRRKYGGTGLGLYICKNIVEAHNGEIWVESEEGVGTTVHIKIPK